MWIYSEYSYKPQVVLNLSEHKSCDSLPPPSLHSPAPGPSCPCPLPCLNILIICIIFAVPLVIISYRNIKKALATDRRQNLVQSSLQSSPYSNQGNYCREAYTRICRRAVSGISSKILCASFLFIIFSAFVSSLSSLLAWRNLVQSSLLTFPISNIKKAMRTASRHDLVQSSLLSFPTGKQGDGSKEEWTELCRRAVTGTSSNILCVSCLCIIFIIFVWSL